MPGLALTWRAWTARLKGVEATRLLDLHSSDMSDVQALGGRRGWGAQRLDDRIGAA